MKRNLFLLTSLLVGATTVMGQNVRPLEKLTPAVSSKMNDDTKAMRTKVSANHILKNVDQNALNVIKNKNVAPREDVVAYYALPNGSFHTGFTPEGYSFQVATVAFPAFSDFSLKNYSTSGATCTWKLGETAFGDILKNPDEYLKIQGDGSLNVNFPIITPSDGFYSWVPTVTATKSGKSDTYFYGSDAIDRDGKAVGAAVGFGAGFGNWLTTGDQAYGIYGAINDQKYFGTGYTKNGEVCTGVLSVFEPMAPLYIRTMGVVMVPSAEGQTLMPADGSVTLTLYKVNSQNQITDEVIATSTAKMSTDITLTENGLYFAGFKFMEKDEDGFEQQVGLSLNEPFAAEVTGFDKAGYNVRFPIALNTNLMGKSYTVHGNNLSYFTPNDVDSKSTDKESNVIDIFLEMDAAYLCFRMADPSMTVTIPVEGGYGVSATIDGQDYNDVPIYSTLDIEDEDGNANMWFNKNEVPSWLTLEVDNEQYKDNKVIAFFVKGEPLGANEGRSAWIHIYTYGAQVSFPVAQGTTGIDATEASAVKAVCQGDDFVLTYTNDVKSVDLMNVAGQKIGSYELNASGSYTIPAANLVKGLYVLKFNGAENAVVKIMK